MKKILVPTDFSENAEKALNYAIQLANKFGATVYILHSYHISSGAGSLMSIDHIVQEDREKELQALVAKVQPLTTTAILDSAVRKGNPVESICVIANKLHVDLIVMGTTGASGVKKLLLGSVASNVIKQSEKPVLAIPNDAVAFNINNITLALDSNKIEELSVLNPAIILSNTFGASLNLLHVCETENEEDSIDSSIKEHLKDKEVPFTYYKLSSSNIGQGIQEFVTRKDSSILCVVAKSRNWLQDIFHSSMSQKMAFESKIPLLVLHG